MATIKNRMKVILAEREMTIMDLARVADEHYTTVHRFCQQEQRLISKDVMARVCNVLKITPGEIYIYQNGEDGQG